MQLTTPPNKSFSEDIRIIKEAIEKNEHITISKFCDGELAILLNRRINNKEFWFDPEDEDDELTRRLLMQAFQYKNPRYFVGITCVNVFGIQTHTLMKLISGQSESNLTWADIWVNSNYSYYLDNIVPLFSKQNTILVCNERGKVENLPFTPHKVFRVKNNAVRESTHVFDEIMDFIFTNNVEDSIFLFCCGPFGNILAHRLTEYQPNNTYLDIGSTLNPYLESEEFKREYYSSTNVFSEMIGGWDNSCRMSQ